MSETAPYSIEGCQVQLPRDHELPRFQGVHRLYDRFLPFVCRQIDSRDEWIVDVGANVGDTAVAMLQACENPIFCAEANEAFYELLTSNVAAAQTDPGRVTCVNALVGTGRFSGVLELLASTARLREGAGGMFATPLDDLLSRGGVDPSGVALLKVDTDGYDGDVILSGERTLVSSRPILFWENYFSTRAQMTGLESFYEAIATLGYQYLWVFDNFGNVMLSECSFKQILDLNRYVASQGFNNCSRTIFYTDILATSDSRVAPARAAVSVYLSQLVEIG